MLDFAFTEFFEVRHSIGAHPYERSKLSSALSGYKKVRRASSLKFSVPVSEWKHFLEGVAR